MLVATAQICPWQTQTFAGLEFPSTLVSALGHSQEPLKGIILKLKQDKIKLSVISSIKRDNNIHTSSQEALFPQHHHEGEGLVGIAKN